MKILLFIGFKAEGETERPPKGSLVRMAIVDLLAGCPIVLRRVWSTNDATRLILGR